MPKCFVYAVRGYRDGKFWDTDGDHTNVMKTRSGRTISTIPIFPPTVTVNKNANPSGDSAHQKNAADYYKQFNRKVVRYRDISYLSVITRCKLMAKQVPVHLLGNPKESIQWIEDSPFTYDQSRWSFDLEERPSDLELFATNELSLQEENGHRKLKTGISKEDDLHKDECFLEDFKKIGEEQVISIELSVAEEILKTNESENFEFKYQETTNETCDITNDEDTVSLKSPRQSTGSTDVDVTDVLLQSEASDDSPFYLDNENDSSNSSSLNQDSDVLESVADSPPHIPESQEAVEDSKIEKEGKNEGLSKKLKSHFRAKDFKLRVCLRPKKKPSKDQESCFADQDGRTISDIRQPTSSASTCSLSDNLGSTVKIPIQLSPKPVIALVGPNQSQLPAHSGVPIRTVLVPSFNQKASILQPAFFNFMPQQNQALPTLMPPTLIPVMFRGQPGVNMKSSPLPNGMDFNSLNFQITSSASAQHKQQAQTQVTEPESSSANLQKFKSTRSNDANEAIKMRYVNNVLKNATVMKDQGMTETKVETMENPGIQANNEKFESVMDQDRSITSSPCGSQTSQSSISSSISDSYALDSDDSSVDFNEMLEKFSEEVHAVLTDNQGNQLHRCLVCSRIFTVLTAFKSHVRTHIRSANKCEICGKVFSRSWLLKGHLRIHTGEKPFVCPHPGCDKAFADRSNLRSHRQTHTNDKKPYVCSVCHRSFAQKRYLHKHRHEVCLN